jgi:polyhydroxybutyrate depolymerase
MKTALALLSLAASLVASPAVAGALGTGDHAGSLVFDGETRIYDLHVPPSYDGATPIPLVLDIHGWLSSKSGQRFFSGFEAIADAEGFAVVWPQGLFGAPGNPEGINAPAGPSWNAGFCCGAAATVQPDDVGFLRTLVEAVARDVAIDRRRVYATGLSNGGAMTQRLACEAADLFAAAAPVSFPIVLIPLDSCAPSRPISVLTFQGLTDVLVPYEGGGSFPSAAASFEHWRARSECGDDPLELEEVLGDSRCDGDTSCGAGVEVGLCSVLSTSAIPGAEGHILYINEDLDVSARAWDFLSRFSLPGEPAPLPGLVEGRKLLLKDGPDAAKRKLEVAVKDPDIVLGALDPTQDGAALQVYNTGGSGESLCVELPAAGWSPKGGGFAYKDKTGAHGPCQSASLKAGSLAVSCSGKRQPLAYSLDETAQESLAVRLASGAGSFCASFGGKIAADAGGAGAKGKFLAKQAPKPGVCPAPRVPCPAPSALP